AELWVEQGRVVDATFGVATGEKALYRVLSVSRGRFSFLPDLPAPSRRIVSPTDELLMNAVHHADEISRLREEIPPLTAQLQLVARPSSCSRVAQEVTTHLAVPRTLQELLDLTTANDFDVLKSIRELLDLGALVVYNIGRRRLQLCREDETIGMRAAAMRLRR